VNFIMTFLASQTFLRGKFEKRKLFLSNSSPTRNQVHVSFQITVYPCTRHATSRFQLYTFCAVCIKTVVCGILFYRYPVVVSAQGFYELAKYVTSAACSANITCCFYMAHFIVNGTASIFLHFQ
jgi:hypothetical protein